MNTQTAQTVFVMLGYTRGDIPKKLYDAFRDADEMCERSGAELDAPAIAAIIAAWKLSEAQ